MMKKRLIIVSFIIVGLSTPLYSALRAEQVSYGSFTKRHPSVYRSTEYSEISLKDNPSSRLTFFEASVQPLDVGTQLSSDGGGGAATILGSVFNYPNPFKFSSGTTIGYALSKDLDIDIYVYDIRGHRIWETTIASGSEGGIGSEGDRYFNKVPFGSDQVGGFMLPSSVYFYVILHDGEVLGKGKMAVIP